MANTTVAKDLRKPTSKVAHNREEDEDYHISKGSARFMTWLGIVLAIPGLVMLIWEAERNIPAGVGFLILGSYIAWTGSGSMRLFK
jgi:hypothetical protein